MTDNYKLLMKAVVLQALKDYANQYLEGGHNTKDEARKVVSWVVKMNGTFDICAHAMDITPKVLQELMRKAMKQIKQEKKPFTGYIKDFNWRSYE